MIETFSDSDWSGNKQHRRSTSCGVHTLNGGFLFASSRTQRVVSLSSCESELHSMVSALCDGIYLRRCIEFLTGCQVEHHLLVDSSSARQVAMRQGRGRLKHVSGKLLWIQQCCRCWDQTFSKQTHSDVTALHWNDACRGWSNHWPGGV